jgi:coenzyme F420-reducing hydrogenase gamma subunit
MSGTGRPKLAVWKFASCDGCQLSILNLEEHLLTLADSIEIAHFPEGFRETVKGPYDISLVEGSISTPLDAERIHGIRRASRTLVAMGACATSGGIQALRNFPGMEDCARAVYPKPGLLEVLKTSTPLADHILVDHEIFGCPVNTEHVVEILTAILSGRRPFIPSWSLCMECKRLGIVCVMVTGRAPCMGPVTRAGCGALCPSVSRGCYGCFGPSETANTATLTRIWKGRFGLSPEQVMRAFRGVNAFAAPFRKEGDCHER